MGDCRLTTSSDAYRREDAVCRVTIISSDAVCLVSDGQLYVGTAADFSDQDPIILRDRLRTDKWDMVVLDGQLSEMSNAGKALISNMALVFPKTSM